MQVIDTRSGDRVASSTAILQGIAPSGGLYVPRGFPFFPLSEIAAMAHMGYAERAVRVLTRLLPSFPAGDLEREIRAAYVTPRFSSEDIAPLRRLDTDLYLLDLCGGPTLAFKDFALQLLPRLMRLSAKITEDERKRLILVATSGDTGKAALESFANQEGFACVVFYPNNGVSAAQKAQMTTQTGDNVKVFAVEGNFDDAQNGVKRLFTSEPFIKEAANLGYTLASANSINYGRLIPQIAYYFSAYADLLKLGRIKAGNEAVFVVPTGNFGNILACDYARRMGLPVKQTILASNANNVLYDFVTTGVYDIRREFAATSSPSMDILISSNLERYLFELCLRNPGELRGLMDTLAKEKRFSISERAKAEMGAKFSAGWTDEAKTGKSICEVWNKYGALIDTHTAVAYSVYKDAIEGIKAKERKEWKEPVVIVSTASPYKFADSVLRALGGVAGENAEESLRELTGVDIPQQISELASKPVLHTGTVGKDDMAGAVLASLRSF